MAPDGIVTGTALKIAHITNIWIFITLQDRISRFWSHRRDDQPRDMLYLVYPGLNSERLRAF